MKNRAPYRFMGLLILFVGLTYAILLSSLDAVEIEGQEIGIDLDFTYVTKYLWHGYDLYANDIGAFQPSVTASWNGLYAQVWGSWADESGYVDDSELDYLFGYEYTLWPEERYALAFNAWYNYFDYYKGRDWQDAIELGLSLSLPNVIPLGPSHLVPHYTLFYDFDTGDTNPTFLDGFFHEFGLEYGIPIPELFPELEEQFLTLGWQITYEDGVYAGVDSGFTHTALSLSTSFQWKGFYFTPTLLYQWSMEDAVNPEDEFCARFSVGYRF